MPKSLALSAAGKYTKAAATKMGIVTYSNVEPRPPDAVVDLEGEAVMTLAVSTSQLKDGCRCPRCLTQ